MTPLLLSAPITPSERAYLEDLGQKFNLNLCYHLPSGAPDYFLLWQDHKIQLARKETGETLGVDFTRRELATRSQHNRGELLLKAVNLKKYREVWDATAGLGYDAFILAAFGAKVTLFEHHPLVACLLHDGLTRARRDDSLAVIARRMDFVFGSITEEKVRAGRENPEVIYLDPMFPERKKSARVKKNMLFLQTLLGEPDNAPLFAAARRGSAQKIVVKRPKLAPPAYDSAPNAILRGNAVRFEVYTFNYD